MTPTDLIPNDTTLWQWVGTELPYLRCQLLAQWQHGFFTRQFWPHPPEKLTKILTPMATTYQLQQIHGNRVVKPSEGIREGDGLISQEPKQAIWVASADCTPILMGDVVNNRVAAVHAGWRGTSQKVVGEAIARLVEEGSKLENIRVALGPGISGKVYQVGLQVAAEVCKSIIQEGETPEAILAIASGLNPSPLATDSQPGRVRLDVTLVNYLQLRQLGIEAQQIAIAPFCTYQQPEYFFSYRRTKEKKVQWSGIVSN